MLGIAVLFFLGLWVVITLIAMRVGWKCGKRTTTQFLGAFLGFMLTMGGFIVHWTIEYYQIQETVTHLCETEGGITVYVTPKEWRKQIGEAEWKRLEPYSSSKQDDFERHDKIINGVNYYSVAKYNKYLIRYSGHEDINQYIGKVQWIIMDIKHKKQLIKATYISAGSGAWFAGGSYKSWLNDIQSCSKEVKNGFNQIILQYSNSTIGEIK